MLMLALQSRLCLVWHTGHTQFLTDRFFTIGFWYPHSEHVWELGYIVGTLITSFPYHVALYWSISKNLDQETLAMERASLWLRIIPFTFKSSMQMVWFSRTSMVDVFCKKSFRWLVTFSWTFATRTRCLLRFFEPVCFLESLRCSLTSFFAVFSRYLGFDTVVPLLSV